MSQIKVDWVDPGAGALSGANMIILPPWWLHGAIIAAPEFHNVIFPCWEKRLEFPEGSLPTEEVAAKFVLAHEIGHSLRQGNRRVLRSFKDDVELPPSLLAFWDGNPIIARNAGRSPFAEEVMADVLAAHLYSPGLLNEEMWNWVEFEMRPVLR